jgi:hypothetical protein
VRSIVWLAVAEANCTSICPVVGVRMAPFWPNVMPEIEPVTTVPSLAGSETSTFHVSST